MSVSISKFETILRLLSLEQNRAEAPTEEGLDHLTSISKEIKRGHVYPQFQ